MSKGAGVKLAETKRHSLRLTRVLCRRTDLAQLQAAFARIDTDHNGLINFSELRAAMASRHMSEEELHRVFTAMDEGGDGQIEARADAGKQKETRLPHSKRSAALSSQRHELRFRYVVRRSSC